MAKPVISSGCIHQHLLVKSLGNLLKNGSKQETKLNDVLRHGHSERVHILGIRIVVDNHTQKSDSVICSNFYSINMHYNNPSKHTNLRAAEKVALVVKHSNS